MYLSYWNIPENFKFFVVGVLVSSFFWKKSEKLVRELSITVWKICWKNFTITERIPGKINSLDLSWTQIFLKTLIPRISWTSLNSFPRLLWTLIFSTSRLFYETSKSIHYPKNAIRSRIFLYMVFVCLYMEVICPNTVKCTGLY